VSRLAWDGSPGEFEPCVKLAEECGATVVVGDWPNEELHRKSAYADLKERGFRYAFTVDGDEVIEPSLLKAMLGVAKADLADRVMCHFDTYWKSPEYVIRPREGIRPVMLVNLEAASHVFCREFEGGRPLILSGEYGVVHHLSYGGPDERIKRKLSTWGHRDEVQDGWYSRVWKAWDENKLMRELHPTHPPAYGFAERIPVPEILKSAVEGVSEPDPEIPPGWPTVSVVIPLYGGAQDIRLCLESLKASADLLHEIIVVDDRSPDDAAEVVEAIIESSPEFIRTVGAGPFRYSRAAQLLAPAEQPKFLPGPDGGGAMLERRIRLISNEENLGFGESCNKGYLQSSGEVVIFLNSDTIVPRLGLVRLIESLMVSGSVGATGPYTNNAGYHQPIAVTYTDVSRMGLFAEDFAARSAEDVDVPILVGFCLAVKRSVIEEVGELVAPPATNGKKGAKHESSVFFRVPFDTRYGRGLFEDNDLCYRIQKAGYKIRIAARSFVHHSGSKSLARLDEHPNALLERNKEIYHAKWRSEIESGFASHLPGQKAEPIVFRKERHPDVIRKRMRELARRADISLCMIVRDEERVLSDCLKSAKDAFSQIVIVDTGSKDRTVEIAREHGAEVYEIPWPDSFAEARNESLKRASGSWIFWLDADDTLPFDSALAMLEAAIQAPKDVVGFVMPVQFVETELAGATRVDHVKLFRNLKGLAFEGHIHEQILPSLRERGGQIGRIKGVVLHSGYDTSVEGQLKKRVRDEKLLGLDLGERPDHPFVLFNVGMTAHYCEDHQTAVAWLEKSLAVSKSEESHVRKVYALLGVSQRKLGEKELALGTFAKGLEVVGEDPELRFQLALTLSDLGRLEQSKEQYLAIKEDYEDHYSSFDISILGFKRYFNLASVCLQLDQYQEAKAWLARAIEETESPRARFEAAESLFHASMAREDFVTAGRALEHMRLSGGYSETWVRYHLDLAAYRGGNAFDALVALVQEQPAQIAPRLLLARQLLDQGRLEMAMPHLELLDDLGCAEAAFFKGVTATRRGDYAGALRCMRRARDLNPNHEQTLQQIAALERQVHVA